MYLTFCLKSSYVLLLLKLFTGKSKKSCNSISVGAFLDEDDDDMSLEEIKNRQNAARNISPILVSKEPSIDAIGDAECDILSMERAGNIIETSAHSRHYEKGAAASKNGFCSPVSSERIISDRKQLHDGSECFMSPISSLMSEFGSLSFQEQELAGVSHKITEKTENEGILDKTCSAVSLASSSEPIVTGKLGETTLRTDYKISLEKERVSRESGIQTKEAQQRQELSSQKFPSKTSPTNGNLKLFLLG